MGLAKFNEPVTMQLIAVQGIYCKAEADMVGPIQTSAFNNKYIITAIDYMSKNIEDAAVLSTSSKTTADFSYRETRGNEQQLQHLCDSNAQVPPSGLRGSQAL
ncbi:MAG: hypothetical protein FRX49_11855 [Trebouxia sp. A1-2]|nr:MAG: hypothetical protein FRX49_11855 [Trebouxia sp. A1-2]